MIKFWFWIVGFSNRFARSYFWATILLLFCALGAGILGAVSFGLTMQGLLTGEYELSSGTQLEFVKTLFPTGIPLNAITLASVTGVLYGLSALLNLCAVYSTSQLGMRAESAARKLVLSGSLGIPERLESLKSHQDLSNSIGRNAIKSRGIGRSSKAAIHLIPNIIKIVVISFLLLQIGVMVAMICFIAFAFGFVVTLFQNKRIEIDETSLLAANAEMKRSFKRGIKKLNYSQADVDETFKPSQRAALLFHTRAVVIAQANTVLSVLGFVLIVALVFFNFVDEEGELTDIANIFLAVLLFRMLYSAVQGVSASVGILFRMRFHIRPVVDYLRGSIPVAVWHKVSFALPLTANLISGMHFNALSKDVFTKAIEYSSGKKPHALKCDEGGALSFQLDGADYRWTLRAFSGFSDAFEACGPSDLLLANILPYAITFKKDVKFDSVSSFEDLELHYDDNDDEDDDQSDEIV